MRKIIKKYGDSLVIVINSEDSKAYNLQEGDIIEISLEKVKNFTKASKLK